MALLHALRYRLEDFTDLFPPLPVFLPTMLVGVLVPLLVADVSPADSAPAVLLLLAVVWRQWFRADALRDRLETRLHAQTRSLSLALSHLNSSFRQFLEQQGRRSCSL